MKKISEIMRDFLSVDGNKIVSHGTFTAQDFNSINEILNDTDRDFMIFDNAGGKTFQIVFDRGAAPEFYPVADFINALLEQNPGWIYMYQIGGVQTVCRKFP